MTNHSQGGTKGEGWNAAQGQGAGQGQEGEEYGVYGRGATEGGRYADEGDSVAKNTPHRNVAQQDIARKEGQPNVEEHARAQNANTDAGVGAQMHENEDNISRGQDGGQGAQKGRQDQSQQGQRESNTLDALNHQATAMSEDAGGPQGARQINNAMREVGRGLGDDRFLEGQPAQDAVRQDHETWKAPRETTWRQNSGAETAFGQQQGEPGSDLDDANRTDDRNETRSPSVDVSKAPTDSSARTGVASEDF
jgi:hypothetical protein